MSEDEQEKESTPEKRHLLTRRKFLWALGTGVTVCAADALFIEPRWIKETRLDMRQLGLGLTMLHFSDLHYRGDAAYAEKIRQRIHELKPDYVFFTGDLLEWQRTTYLEEICDWLKGFSIPLFAVPGNHDPVGQRAVTRLKAAFQESGGDYLTNQSVQFKKFELHGIASSKITLQRSPLPGILLCHYPDVGHEKMDRAYELILAGHSHGGQLRVPFIGAPVVPPGCGGFVKGLYDSSAGPLYVNVGIGSVAFNVRFACRPELTIIET